jgi:hypothetical protein
MQTTIPTIEEIKRKIQPFTEKNLNEWTFFFNKNGMLEFYKTSREKSSIFLILEGKDLNTEDVQDISSVINHYEH